MDANAAIKQQLEFMMSGLQARLSKWAQNNGFIPKGKEITTSVPTFKIGKESKKAKPPRPEPVRLARQKFTLIGTELTEDDWKVLLEIRWRDGWHLHIIKMAKEANNAPIKISITEREQMNAVLTYARKPYRIRLVTGFGFGVEKKYQIFKGDLTDRPTT